MSGSGELPIPAVGAVIDLFADKINDIRSELIDFSDSISVFIFVAEDRADTPSAHTPRISCR